MCLRKRTDAIVKRRMEGGYEMIINLAFKF